MDRKTLNEIRVRCDVAEEAVWRLDVGDCNISDNGTCDRDCCNGCGTWKWSAGADRIIQSLKDIPALLDYIAKLEAESAELRARLEKVEVSCDSCRLFNTDSYAYYTYPCSECKCRARDSYEAALEVQGGSLVDV